MDNVEKIHIIVVDDEPISADSLSELIEDTFRADYPLEVRTAYNGASVMRMIAESPCDILISDIQMPGMSGLALAKQLREHDPHMSILFLTGFDDFQYAYEAFRQKAVHYLLKTEGDEAILNTIRDTITSLLRRKQMIARIHEAESRFAQMLPAYRRQLLMQVLMEAAPAESLRELEDFDCSSLYLVIGRSEEQSHHMSPQLKLTVLSTVENTMSESLGEYLLWSESYLLENTFVWVFSMRNSRSYADTMFQLIRKARKCLDEQLAITLFFVVADESVDAAQIQSKFLQLHGMLTREILHGATGAAIGRTRVPPVSGNQAQTELRQCLSQCLRDIHDGTFDLLAKHLPPITHYLRQTARIGDPFAEECASSLLGAIMSSINRNGSYPVLAAADAAAPRGTATWFEHMVQSLQEEFQKQQDYAIHSITQYVTTYIREHISENIGTSYLAEVSGYSTGYLSRIFKQQMNMSIHEYITSVRMELAKDLLTNTNFRVYEIASSCGYDNTAYFIKVFKAQTGQTPQEYKQDLFTNKSKSGWRI